MRACQLPFVLVLATTAWGCTAAPLPEGGSLTPTERPIDQEADPAILERLPVETRTFRMGTAGFVPRGYPESTEEDWARFLEEDAAAYGELYGVHVSPSAKKNESGVPEQVQLAFEGVQGVETYVAFAVSHEEGPFTQARGEELKRAAVATAREYQPRYLSLGVESNSLLLFQEDTFDLYVQYAREAYGAIKAVSPGTSVMNNFQLERMKGQTELTGQDFGPHWHVLERFAGKMDLISFTVYPFLAYEQVERIPDDYLAEIRAHTDLPVMITETGWPTEDLASGAQGSHQDQIEYLLKLVEQANQIDVEAIIWVFPHDAPFGIAGGIFDHLSLLDNDGNQKPAYAYWLALPGLPLRSAPEVP